MRPAKVKVLGKTYSVTYTMDAPVNGDDIGECDHVRQAITIRDGQPLEGEQDTVLHEVIHAGEYLLGLRVKHDDIVRLTTFILDLVKSNPKLISYLKRKA